MKISLVTEGDLSQVLPLMRAYCRFYQVNPSDDDLLGMSRSLLADPSGMGVQLMARNHSVAVVGFATLVWTWSTLSASLIGIMNDLFVVPEARGLGVADELIAACCAQCRLEEPPCCRGKRRKTTTGLKPSTTEWAPSARNGSTTFCPCKACTAGRVDPAVHAFGSLSCCRESEYRGCVVGRVWAQHR